MKPLPLEKLKQQLMELRARLRSDTDRQREAVMEQLHPTGEISPARTNAADSSEAGLEVTAAVIEAEQAIETAIEAALDRMEQGVYGKCEKCAQDIAIARLEAIPYATRCVRCAGADALSHGDTP